MLDGQLAQNQAVESPGLFIKDANGGAVKIGPIHLGAVAPNATPAGSAGNSIGEAWLDTSLARPILKVWDGAAWLPVGGSGGGCATGETAPTAPQPGDLWFRTDICQLFVWYDDGDSQQWVQANGGGGGGGDFVEVAGDTMTGNLTVPSLNGGQLAGFRNVLINGAVTINQRGVTYAAAAVGGYWADRWKKTAGGMTQVVEEGNFIPGAVYTLSGKGVTTQQVTAPASGDWTIPDVPATATEIQLELGIVATPFERRLIAVELTLCQRYYEQSYSGANISQYSGNVTAGSAYYANVGYNTTKRAAGTISLTNLGGNTGFSATPGAVGSSSTGGFREQRSASATGSGAYLSSWTCNAEL
jgi:hypothetical protein